MRRTLRGFATPRRFALFLGVALALLGSAAHGQSGATERVVRVTMQGGDMVTGVLLDRAEDGTATLRHPVLGVITIPGDRIQTVTPEAGLTPDALDFTPEAQEEAYPPEEEVEEAAPEAVAESEEKSPWSLSLNLGLNGSTGNSEIFNFRGGFDARRERETDIFLFTSTYKLATENGTETENRWFNRIRQEWLEQDSPWTYFLQGTLEVDEFQDYDSRVAGQGGFGYRFIDTEETFLIGRLGAGAAREFGGEEDEVIPEAFAGAELRHEIDERSRFTTLAEIFPDLDEGGEFRSRVEGAYEIDMTNDGAWVLRLGAEHRYDSDPGDAERVDVDYFLTLVFNF